MDPRNGLLSSFLLQIMEGNRWKMEWLYTHFESENEFVAMADTAMELGKPDEVFNLVRKLKERQLFFQTGRGWPCK